MGQEACTGQQGFARRCIINSGPSLGRGHGAALSFPLCFDLYREHVSLGFYPLPDSERDDFCMSELGMWELFSGPRAHMYQMYRQRLDEAIRENGELNLGMYMRQALENNTALSREQKDRLLEKYTGGRWSPEETNKRFHRLFYVMLGILSLRGLQNTGTQQS